LQISVRKAAQFGQMGRLRTFFRGKRHGQKDSASDLIELRPPALMKV
jgi:hypothetical protein